MPDAEEIIDRLGLDRRLVLRFFGVFSRFEYALKRCGFLVGDKAEPNWDAYANSLRGKFASVRDQTFTQAVAFLQAHPPKKQIVSGQSLDWEDTYIGDGEQHENYVLRLVRIVRNNLFHGGKYPVPVGLLEDVGRNSALLEASIAVLGKCLCLSVDVREKFDETA